MAKTGSIATRKMVEFLTLPASGVNAQVAQLASDSGVELAPIAAAQVVAQNVSAELNERSVVVKYPVVHIYTDRVRNNLTEKKPISVRTRRGTKPRRGSRNSRRWQQRNRRSWRN